MSGFLLDTNCISEAVRVHPEPRVLSWLGAADESLLHLSVLTLGEIRKGVAALAQSKRRTLWKPGWKRNFRRASLVEFCPSTRVSPTAGVSSPRH